MYVRSIYNVDMDGAGPICCCQCNKFHTIIHYIVENNYRKSTYRVFGSEAVSGGCHPAVQLVQLDVVGVPARSDHSLEQRVQVPDEATIQDSRVEDDHESRKENGFLDQTALVVVVLILIV